MAMNEDVFHHLLRQKSQHQKSQCQQAIYNTWLWCNFLKDWNTGGSSSQPTVAPPLPASEVRHCLRIIIVTRKLHRYTEGTEYGHPDLMIAFSLDSL
ncbi:unnamed protein product [Arctia plantaginis]|uniref:Uncharacterized protein n=1 Tax=Arctia plantaginis TaxID=874455 RepID=A0A8S0ZQ88_ARCPL|nr:unnamed protein product [Arctia plantaginis]